jgi:predicted MFS family arabinose efflux permease
MINSILFADSPLATQGLYSGGGIFGCCLIAWLADKLGRKRAVQLVCTICVISAILQAASVHIAMLLVGRFLNGLGYVIFSYSQHDC